MRKLVKWLAGVPHLYAKCIILWCVFWGTAFCGYAIRADAHNAVSTAASLGIAVGFLGGELLMLCVKTVFRKKDKEDTI